MSGCRDAAELVDGSLPAAILANGQSSVRNFSACQIPRRPLYYFTSHRGSGGIAGSVEVTEMTSSGKPCRPLTLRRKMRSLYCGYTVLPGVLPAGSHQYRPLHRQAGTLTLLPARPLRLTPPNCAPRTISPAQIMRARILCRRTAQPLTPCVFPR